MKLFVVIHSINPGDADRKGITDTITSPHVSERVAGPYDNRIDVATCLANARTEPYFMAAIILLYDADGTLLERHNMYAPAFETSTTI